MLWFIATSTVILTFALLAPAGLRRRRVLEASVLLVLLLPALRWALEATGMKAWEGARAAGPSGLAIPDLFMLLWIAGGIFCLARLLRQGLRIGKIAKGAKPVATAGIMQVLELDAKTVARHFRHSAQVDTPMVLPTFPATVILPATWDQWNPRLQASALRHEWHHVQAGDAVWRLLMQIFCAVLWFHPLAWRLNSCWAEECERCADGAAMGTGDPADYASDLLTLVQSERVPGLLALGFTGSGKHRLQRRVEALFQERRGGVPVRTLLLLAGLALGCAWTGIRHTAKAELRQEASIRLSAEAFPADL